MPRSGLRLTTAIAAAAAGALLAHLLWLAAPNVFVSLDDRLADRLLDWRNRRGDAPPIDPRLAIVELNDDSIRSLGRNPDRGDLAQLSDRLRQSGAALQIYDFLFEQPGGSADEDAAMTAAFNAAPDVVVGTALATSRTPETSDIFARLGVAITVKGSLARVPVVFAATPVVWRASGTVQIAPLNLHSDPDGTYRRTPLLYRSMENRLILSLTLRAALDVLRIEPAALEFEPGVALRIRGAKVGSDKTSSDLAIPVDETGALRINYSGGWETSFNHYWITQLLGSNVEPHMADWRRELDDSVVFVADTSTGRGDVGATPVDRRMPLVGVHAAALNTILTGAFLYDPAPIWVWAAELALLLVLIPALSYLRWYGSVATIAVVGIMYSAGIVAGLMRGHVLFPVLRPLFPASLATITLLLTRYGAEERARGLLRRSFSAYFPPEIVAQLERDNAFLRRPARRKTLSILFSDIRGFTHRSSSMAPEDVHALLNEYFDAMVAIVFSHGGTVDKFIGDGLMAFWNDPVDQPDHAERAVRAALAMQALMREKRHTWRAVDGSPMEIRIGITTGPALVGNLGSGRRLSYTAIGSTVNLAQRLESNAPPGGILISRETQAALPAGIAVEAHGQIPVKGLDASVETFVLQP